MTGTRKYTNEEIGFILARMRKGMRMEQILLEFMQKFVNSPDEGTRLHNRLHRMSIQGVRYVWQTYRDDPAFAENMRKEDGGGEEEDINVEYARDDRKERNREVGMTQTDGDNVSDVEIVDDQNKQAQTTSSNVHQNPNPSHFPALGQFTVLQDFERPLRVCDPETKLDLVAYKALVLWDPATDPALDTIAPIQVSPILRHIISALLSSPAPASMEDWRDYFVPRETVVADRQSQPIIVHPTTDEEIAAIRRVMEKEIIRFHEIQAERAGHPVSTASTGAAEMPPLFNLEPREVIENTSPAITSTAPDAPPGAPAAPIASAAPRSIQRGTSSRFPQVDVSRLHGSSTSLLRQRQIRDRRLTSQNRRHARVSLHIPQACIITDPSPAHQRSLDNIMRPGRRVNRDDEENESQG